MAIAYGRVAVARYRDKKVRLLPTYISLLATSYLFFCLGVILHGLNFLGTPFTWRAVIFTVAVLIGDVALTLLAMFLYKHVTIDDSTVRIERIEIITDLINRGDTQHGH